MPRLLARGLSSQLVRQLSVSLAAVRGEMIVSGQAGQWLADEFQLGDSPAQAADALAHAIVCGSTIAQRFQDNWRQSQACLMEQAAPWERLVLERIGSTDGPKSNASFSDLTHLYEHVLLREQPDRRKRAGVFYTPQPIVRYMLRQIDAQLREEFSLPLGLADEATWGDLRHNAPSLAFPRGASDGDPFVKLFDPAAGTGTFLLEAIDFIRAALVKHWRDAGMGDDEIANRWNDYVPRLLLPRLWGMELLPVPCFLARLHVALKLAQTGYRFDSPARIEMHLGNTLAGPSPPLMWCTRSASALPLAERADHFEPAYDVPFTVVLGNPPFSYLSENQSPWITSLVRGENGHAGYLHVNGQKLGEKKTWLHDDYVKFLRYAQWRIEATGCGIVALVTNHGYLTNATFRILRQQLLAAFPRISVLDLHGNRKAREVAPDGASDENVFGLDQGIAIGFFRRPPREIPSQVQHAELWATRQEKFQRLHSVRIENQSCVPAPPDFLLAPAAAEVHAEYAAAPPLTEILPVHATAPVTARDLFVVAFTHSELCARIEAFRDLSIPDDEIRRRFFTRTRSPRYELGDTRGWKLAAARRTIAALDDWQSFIQPCQYRPLDWRWIFWHPAMIDWPRHEVTSHFVSPKSQVPSPKSDGIGDFGLWTLDFGLALIARRQHPPSEPATYFWATTALPLDGIIRNDNRGSESLFVVDRDSAFEKMASYAYALFHSPTYRQRYAAELRTNFPRVLLARDDELTARLADLGRQLVTLHTQRPTQFVGWDKPALAGAGPPEWTPESGGPAQLAAASRWSHPTAASQRLLVAPRFPQYDAGRIWIRDDNAIAAADEGTWQFRVGAHQVARKWLADRRGRALTEADLAWYGVILDTIAKTRTLVAAVDAAIADHGGFPAAFQ